ncbi:MAG: hypothetical protein EZS28_042822 [Streblomastix strix]|uniref:Uncharacterized protein n=1 Tax=Streblomastix strix TaxID=222440 RepID=A0A5J4TVQ7_9EUKA|nr:MAG: hypothetical protein EZS28_042822 [Streblomastix strix]
MRFFELITLGHIRIWSSPPLHLFHHSLFIRSFADFCVLTPLSREDNAVAKCGRGQLALLQVVFHNPHYFRIMSLTLDKANKPLYYAFTVFKE